MQSISTGEIQRRLAAGERDFHGASLPGANLKDADLKGADLRGANFRGANLHGADLREARLMRTDLSMADLGRTDLASADLTGADCRGANFKGANFAGANLEGANLRGADLNGGEFHAAKLIRVDLSRADLRLSDLSHADLRAADLRGADLSGAHLARATLHSATLHGADLQRADLSATDLRGANFTETRFEATVFNNAMVGGTVFADLDLREARGLEKLQHASPSTVGLDTLSRSLGTIPEDFLRGCGLTAWEILTARLYDPTLAAARVVELQEQSARARAHGPLQRKRVLISYSQLDVLFVEEMRRLFSGRGILTWVAPHEMKGALRERQSKLPIQHDLALVLVLSQHSALSDWVEHEVKLSRNLEKTLGEAVLCPISLDDSWKASSWQAKIVERVPQESVLSFSEWSDPSALETQFERLVEGLDLFHTLPAAGVKA
jgi:uncharacterized protein YjbI with pentapeptide repeats